MDRPTAN